MTTRLPTSPWLIGALVVGAIALGVAVWPHRSGDAAAASDTPRPSPAAAYVPPAPMAAPAPAAAPAPPSIEEPPLSVQIERLLATRSPEDAYRAYRLVADCASFNLNHDRIVFDQEALTHWKGDSLPGFRALTEDEKRHDAKLCGALTERERQSRLDYLAIAAKAGVPGAAVSFAVEGPFGDTSALQTRPGDPLVQAWKQTAGAQLTRAAESGADPGALQYLAGEYAHGSALLDKNPLLAYRYLVANSLITEETIGPADPVSQSLAARRQGFANMVQDYSPQQRAVEEAAARRIADLAKAQREQAARKSGSGG